MANGRGSIWIVRIIAFFTIIFIIIIGIALGFSLAMTRNIINNENFTELAPALPTKLLDINGVLITEFASDEKRELISLSELPRHLIYAVLSREDPDFYNHRGFSIRALTRAAFYYAIGKPRGGGSTITQQVAGWLYTDRGERTIERKVKELWWAFQMERRYTKNEILEIYLNYMPMGPGTYGVETSSKHFFGHSAREVTIAESAALAVLLSGPNRFDPIRNPSLARDRQKFVIDRMVEFGHITAEEGEASLNEYWDNFDWTQSAVSAYFKREDKAPWFSEYVRRELEVLMYGNRDYYRDGYVVHTTLDLHHQETAERLMAEGLERANREYARSNSRSYTQAERNIMPIINMLTLAFDIPEIRYAQAGQNEVRAMSHYTRIVNPVIDMAALAFGLPDLKDITKHGIDQLRTRNEQNIVEGALISIENETGYISAIIGGSKYDESNQLIRASQANVQYGSAFKPLYYSAAIDSKKFNASTLIHDGPIIFYNEDKTPYLPSNFRGEWHGNVLFYYALAQSMNVPSLKVLDTVGFDAAIDRAALLLDITDSTQKRRLFPRVYPMGLGITASSPMRLARAYAIFGNQGMDVTPIAIRYIEDRNGRTIFDIEGDVRQRQRRSRDNQIISQQNAYIMTRIMEFTVEEGSLAGASGWGSKFTYRDEQGSFRIPVAGKTGTPQNWSDAWTVGYSPYYTTAVWFGFDRPGNSLGVDLTGATLAGPVWGDYMREIHRGLPRKNFVRPSTGIIDVSVCKYSGFLRGSNCDKGIVTLPFLEGTAPYQFCEECGRSSVIRTPTTPTVIFNPSLLDPFQMPELDAEFRIDLNPPRQNNQRQPASRTQPSPRNTPSTQTVPQTESVIPPPVTPRQDAQDTQRDEPVIIPDTPVLFIPDEEDIFDILQDLSYDDDDYSDLPDWNPLN